MNGAALVAIAATIGNFLQGWDNATIAGAIVYIKKELHLGAAAEGLIVAMSLIGATLVTTCSGAVSDRIGRRPMLILASMFYFLGGLIMLWAPNVHVLLLARLLDGFGIGISVILAPLYVSETAPAEIRGLLNTLSQFAACGGMFLAYCMVFGMSLSPSPSWRGMLGVLSVPSLLYFALMVFYLPESPRWLVSKGRMLEAEQVLRRLRGREDVSDEMALLVGGLAVEGETSIEEYIISPGDELGEDQELTVDRDSIKSYGPEAGPSWVARPITGGSRLSLASHQGSMVTSSVPLTNPLVTLFDSVREKLLETGSIFGTGSDENLQSLLISRCTEKVTVHPESQGSISKDLIEQHLMGPATVHPSENSGNASILATLLEPGVKRALIVGTGIQILQQFSGINGVLYYTPQILQQAGVDVLLSNLGFGSDSSSFLISAFTNFLMLPSNVVAMRFLDISGRRSLLLTTIPVLIISLVVLVIGNVFDFGNIAHAIISTICVVIYLCTFVMGYGPIPCLLCTEIFPTRVRGICIAICALAFWISDVIVTYTLPAMLSSIGLAGVFGIYAVVCVVSWIFVFLKVAETKGMPLEVITEFFAVGAKQGAA